jgi:hypothetical protein
MNYDNMERSDLIKLARERRGPANYEVWDKPMLVAFLKNSPREYTTNTAEDPVEIVDESYDYDDLEPPVVRSQSVPRLIANTLILTAVLSIIILWVLGLVSLAIQGWRFAAGWFT